MAKPAREKDATANVVSLEAVGRVVGTLKQRAAALAQDVAALDALLEALTEATRETSEPTAAATARARVTRPRPAPTPPAEPPARPQRARSRAPAAGPPQQDVRLTGPRGANARAVFKDEGLLVLQGSEMSQTTVPSMPEALKAARDGLIEGRVVTRVGKALRFTCDHFFPSVSTAAAVVMGRNANGWNEWRDAEGRPLKELLRRP
jgi:hypothetical protein